MINCNTNIDIILDSENIGDSLPKINNNFTKLEDLTKKIRNEINISKNVRTFFYYGPNAPANDSGTSGMDNNNTSRPSNTTIQNFVNNTLGLNSTGLSKAGDIVYVVYQKTGWYTPDPMTYTRSGTGSVQFNKQEAYTVAVTRRIGIGGKGGGGTVTTYETRFRTIYQDQGYSWTANISDTYNNYAPIFVIYKLTYNGTQYTVEDSYPKYTYATTGSTINWNNPQSWYTY
jgi:hypothetical protein